MEFNTNVAPMETGGEVLEITTIGSYSTRNTAGESTCVTIFPGSPQEFRYLIDVGNDNCHKNDKLLKKFIAGMSGGSARVIITHSHGDHIGMAIKRKGKDRQEFGYWVDWAQKKKIDFFHGLGIVESDSDRGWPASVETGPQNEEYVYFVGERPTSFLHTKISMLPTPYGAPLSIVAECVRVTIYNPACMPKEQCYGKGSISNQNHYSLTTRIEARTSDTISIEDHEYQRRLELYDNDPSQALAELVNFTNAGFVFTHTADNYRGRAPKAAFEGVNVMSLPHHGNYKDGSAIIDNDVSPDHAAACGNTADNFSALLEKIKNYPSALSKDTDSNQTPFDELIGNIDLLNKEKSPRDGTRVFNGFDDFITGNKLHCDCRTHKPVVSEAKPATTPRRVRSTRGTAPTVPPETWCLFGEYQRLTVFEDKTWEVRVWGTVPEYSGLNSKIKVTWTWLKHSSDTSNPVLCRTLESLDGGPCEELLHTDGRGAKEEVEEVEKENSASKKQDRDGAGPSRPPSTRDDQDTFVPTKEKGKSKRTKIKE